MRKCCYVRSLAGGLLTVLRTRNAEASGGRLTACTPGGVRRFALLGMGAGSAMRGLLATDNWRRGIRCCIRLVPLLGPLAAHRLVTHGARVTGSQVWPPPSPASIHDSFIILATQRQRRALEGRPWATTTTRSQQDRVTAHCETCCGGGSCLAPPPAPAPPPPATAATTTAADRRGIRRS